MQSVRVTWRCEEAVEIVDCECDALMRCGLVYTVRAVWQRVAGVGGLLALLAR